MQTSEAASHVSFLTVSSSAHQRVLQAWVLCHYSFTFKFYHIDMYP